jgi:hypothetical protein
LKEGNEWKEKFLGRVDNASVTEK